MVFILHIRVIIMWPLHVYVILQQWHYTWFVIALVWISKNRVENWANPLKTSTLQDLRSQNLLTVVKLDRLQGERPPEQSMSLAVPRQTHDVASKTTRVWHPQKLKICKLFLSNNLNMSYCHCLNFSIAIKKNTLLASCAKIFCNNF